MKKMTKARLSGLIFTFSLFFFSCNNKEQEKKDVQVFQYPTDTLWRGIPMFLEHKLYKDNSLTSVSEDLIKSTELKEDFNYLAGVPESKVGQLKLKLKQQKTFNYAFLKSLGVPMDKEARENLKYLNLSERGLTHVPPEISILQGLIELQLSYNNIRRLGPQTFLCKNLKRIDLSSNIVDFIPSEISYLKNLEELILRDNRLTTLPQNLSQLKKLRTLDLSNMHRKLSKGYNNFTYIPPSVCHLTELEKLLLENLPIQVIPVNIIYLKNLKVLSLNGCYNLNVYNAIRILSNMNQLQVLDISFTGTRRIPNEIINLKNLKVLVWQEEGNYNKDEVERIKALMPETRIYSGNESRPFLRSNSINTILNGY